MTNNALVANVNRYLRKLQRASNIMDGEIGHQLSALIFLLDGNEDGALVHLALIEDDADLRRFQAALLQLAELTRRELIRRKPERENWS